MHSQYLSSTLALLAFIALGIQPTAGEATCHDEDDSCEAVAAIPERAEAMLQVDRRHPFKAFVKDTSRHEPETRIVSTSAKEVDSSFVAKATVGSEHHKQESHRHRKAKKAGAHQKSKKAEESLSKVGHDQKSQRHHVESSLKLESKQKSSKEENHESEDDSFLMAGHDEKSSAKEDERSSGDQLHEQSSNEKEESSSKVISRTDQTIAKAVRDALAKRDGEQQTFVKEWEARQMKLEQELTETKSQLHEAKEDRQALAEQLKKAQSKAAQRQTIFQQLADSEGELAHLEVKASEPQGVSGIFQELAKDQGKGDELYSDLQALPAQDSKSQGALSGEAPSSTIDSLHEAETDTLKEHGPTFSEFLKADLASVKGAELRAEDAWVMKSNENNDDDSEESDTLSAKDDKSTKDKKKKQDSSMEAADDAKATKKEAAEKEEDKDEKKDNQKINYEKLAQKKAKRKVQTNAIAEKLSKESKATSTEETKSTKSEEKGNKKRHGKGHKTA